MKSILVILLLAFSKFGRLAVFASEDDHTKRLMVDDSDGWMQKATERESAVFHTHDGGKQWLNVTPPALTKAAKRLFDEHLGEMLSDVAALCPLDARRAWVSITPWNSGVVVLDYTADAGQHWEERVAPIAVDTARISFVDELHGFLLALGSPAGGKMDKKLYGTEDGAKHWHVLTPPEAGGCYPTGIFFRSPTDGWITATYHGGDSAPLYRTRDGGKSWTLQKLDVPGGLRGGYVDTYPPVFIGAEKKQGYLPVKLVRNDPKPGHGAWVTYETEDSGETWHVPASGIPPVPDE